MPGGYEWGVLYVFGYRLWAVLPVVLGEAEEVMRPAGEPDVEME